MKPGDARNWDELKALFQEAIDLPPHEREAFLTRRCGEDAKLRSELESLLASHEDERPFLDSPPIPGAAAAFADGLEATDEPRAGLLPGTTIGQYEVAERLGAGGMGDVYRARDTKLDRFVALKILHDAAASGRSADRVLREARAASALNHPHICTIHEVGDFDGRPYLAMEYIAGHSLSRVIPAEGLSAADVIKYGVQIADALAHAHEHGVIHRDLKGANVVVTPQGQAKVLDFGLARRLTAGDGSPHSATLTRAGTIAGTLAYMAPELLRGQKADARSDIWALGVLLYEMASGRRPFEGETPFEVTSAILNDNPVPLPSRVPTALRAIIARCLHRNPEARFQRASEVKRALEATGGSNDVVAFGTVRVSRGILLAMGTAAALLVLASVVYQRGWRGSEAVPTRNSIAVLPFQVLSGAESIAFLGIGLPDTITSRLALVSGMRVPPTNAVLDAQKKAADPQHAGNILAVKYVLTGTVERSGPQIRITPQLLRVADGTTFWTRGYTLSSTDLLGLQDQIAEGVVNALEIEVTSAERTRLSRRYTQNPEAYGLYLRGRSQLVRGQPESAEAAIESFRAALANDQDYALAHAGLAAASAKMRLFFATEPDVAKWETLAHQAARRALELDPALAEAHEALAAVYRYAEFDWNQAIEESDKALELNPHLDQPHLYRASSFLHFGLFDQVTEETRAAMEINPASTTEPLRVQGVAAMFAGRFEEAVAFLEKASNEGGKLQAEWNLATAYYYAGRKTEAEEMLSKVRGGARSQRRAQATLASFLAARRKTAEARKLIDVVTRASYRDHHVEYAVGAAYAQLGMVNDAIQWLTLARSTGFPCYPWFERDPLLAPLKSAAPYRQFLEELKRTWETTAVRHQARR